MIRIRGLILLLGMLWMGSCIGQNKNTIDVGGFLSTNYLLGDVNSNSIFSAQRPKFGIAARYNMKDRYTLQGHFGVGFLYDQGTIDPNIARMGLDNTSTGAYEYNRYYYEIGASWDFNWKPFVVESRFNHFTFFTGLGFNFLYFPENGHGPQNVGYVFSPAIDGEQSVFTVGVPFKLGGKWRLSNYRSISVSFIAQKLFSDAADNIDDPYKILSEAYPTSFKANDALHNNDWIFELKVSLFFQVYHGCRACPGFN
ncbi:DUF6089 family protein [Halosquirtibacter xylanolyticus]|uniref:DUF6089 family protein n=1 Tax=Halosquirtibacter xylanolyticus TaxID=3374599 RepID=UPI0037494B01|nr:DUF6089 family protein [Prolixibacteraceae bacterium]